MTPFSRLVAPVVAVVWTTSLAFGASAGGVTVNVAVTGWPGATSPKAAGPAGCAVQPCGSCRAAADLP